MKRSSLFGEDHKSFIRFLLVNPFLKKSGDLSYDV